MKAARGMHKVEFFTHIDEIRSMYAGGYVVLKVLYEELKKKYNWSMSYWSFCKYMKEEVIPLEITSTPNNETTPQYNSQIRPEADVHEEEPKQTTEVMDKDDKEMKQNLAQKILERNAAFISDKWK